MKKKVYKNLFKNIIIFFQQLWLWFDKKIVLPVTKGILWVLDSLKDNRNKIEKWFVRRNTLIFISLIIALIFFFLIDKKANLLIENSAEILYGQPVKTIYNEEAYVIEGLPKTVDITLIGRKADLYLAKQIPSHEISVDLSGLKPGTHKVNIKYKQSISSIDYKLDPSFTTVVIYPKVSTVKKLTVDLLHQDNLDKRLFIDKTEISKDEVIIKGAEYKLQKVATVKALVDINNLVNTTVGKTTLSNIPLIAYDETGTQVDVEIVPSKVNADITITSPSKEVPIKVIPVGDVSFGKAINTININSTQVTIYGDEKALANINYVPVEINVAGLKSNKEYNMTLKKPLGVRYMSINNVNISVNLETEINKEINNVRIEYKNLGPNLAVQAVSAEDTAISVVVKGTENAVNNLDPSTIHAYVDLSNYGVGDYSVDVKVTGDDLKINYLPKVKQIKIKIINQ
jgi:YbbR domain-containing protein